MSTFGQSDTVTTVDSFQKKESEPRTASQYLRELYNKNKALKRANSMKQFHSQASIERDMSKLEEPSLK